VPYRIVTTRDYAPVDEPEERYAQIKQRRMEEITAERVVAACEELLARTELPK
jgi:hypothetical protein